MGLIEWIFGNSSSEAIREMIGAGSSVKDIANTFAHIDGEKLKKIIITEINSYFDKELKRLRNDLDYKIITRTKFAEVTAKIIKKKNSMLAAAEKL